MEVERSAPPPTRHEEALRADPELSKDPPSGAKIAIFVIMIAVVMGAVFYGLASINAPKLAGKYGECDVVDLNRGRWGFECKDMASFHTAVDEFARKNPKHKVSGIFVR